jgi:hypothetical protein
MGNATIVSHVEMDCHRTFSRMTARDAGNSRADGGKQDKNRG